MRDKDLYPSAEQVIFADRFLNPTQVAKNGGIISGAVVTRDGKAVFSGASGNQITYRSGLLAGYSGPLTLACSIKTSNAVQTAGIFGNGFSGAGTGTYTAYQQANIFVTFIGGASGAYSCGHGNCADGIWHRLVATRSGTTIKGYKDAALLSTLTPANVPLNAVQLLAGTRGAGGIDYWQGEMRDPIICLRAWDQNDINADLANRLYCHENNDVLFLPMHDRIGSAAPFTTSDVSRFGRDATLGDGATSSTFPTKLPGMNGYSLDGGDYFERSMVTSGTFSISCWVQPSNFVNRYLCDARDAAGTGYIYINGSSILVSSGTVYSDGLATTTLTNGLKNIIVSGITLNITSKLIIGGSWNLFAGTGFAGQYRGFRLMTGTLSPVQVKDLYFKGPDYRGAI